jgi:hypothetical protein
MNTPQGARNAWWWRGLSWGIAGKITFDIYKNRAFWQHWQALPVVYASKIIYCWSAARSIESGFAFE